MSAEPLPTPDGDAGDNEPGTISASFNPLLTLPPGIVTNGLRQKVDKEVFKEPLPMAEIIQRMRDATGDWPRAVAGQLFVDDEASQEVDFLPDAAALFGWLQNSTGQTIDWYGGPGFTTKQEACSEYRRVAKRYAAVSRYPHFPPIEGYYYKHPEIVPGDGAALAELLGRFCPLTEIDRDLIKAAVVTPFWGGLPGSRPGFGITSPDRGCGKSKNAALICDLSGGSFDLDADERIPDFKKRLLTLEALSKRTIGCDNIKSDKFSWASVEGLMTAKEISGHRMYQGEGGRPNHLTWFLTMNGMAMSRDFAQRYVIIKLGKPEFSTTWEDDITKFIEANRWKIIADIAAFFQQEPVTLAKCSRWGSWERAILARLPEPEEAQAIIAERQGEVDADCEEAGHIEEFFERQLVELHYDPAADRVHIPMEIARQWFNLAAGQKHSTLAVSRRLSQGIADSSLSRLLVNPCRSYGRGYLWCGSDKRVAYDLADRRAVNQRYGEQQEHWTNR